MTKDANPDSSREPPSEEAPKRCAVILNRAAGTFDKCRRELDGLEGRLREAGYTVTVDVLEPDQIDETLDERLGDEPTLVVAGGGDGTIQSVTRRLVEGPHVLGVLPLGTMNRFAGNLGLPRTVPEAIDVLASGRDRSIDLGEIGGMLFLDSCSLGLYPELSRRRERRRERHLDWPNVLRWVVDSFAAAWVVLRNWRLLRFRLEIDDERLEHRVPALLVVNHPMAAPYGAEPGDHSKLGLYVPRVVGRLSLAWLTLKAVVFGPKRVEPLEVRMVEEAVLRVPKETPVALDAEVVELESPMTLRARPKACRVRMPADASLEPR